MTDKRYKSSVRHPAHDYSMPGAYFITICTSRRRELLGKVENAECVLSSIGDLTASQLLQVPQHYSNVELDAWTVMPNHIHAILFINGLLRQEDRMAKTWAQLLGVTKLV